MVPRHFGAAVEAGEFPIDALLGPLTRGAPTGRGSDELITGFLVEVWTQLSQAFDGASPRHVLLVPSSVRRAAGRRHQVCVPRQVLAVADGVLVFWADLLGVLARVPVGEIGLIEDVALADHRRLTLIARGRRISLRYGPGSRRQVQEFITVLGRLSGPGDLIAKAPLGNGPPSTTWWHDLREMYAAGGAQVVAGHLGGWGLRPSRPCVIAATDQELVIVRSPPQPDRGQAVDLIHVARQRVRQHAPRRGALVLDVGGLTSRLPVGVRTCVAWQRRHSVPQPRHPEGGDPAVSRGTRPHEP